MKWLMYVLVYGACIHVHASWADNVLKNMSLHEKVAQVIFPEVKINNPDHVDVMVELVHMYTFGGVLLVNDTELPRCTPAQQREIVLRFVKASSIPLLITQDCEWGLAQRLRDVVEFPRSAYVAHYDEAALYDYGADIGRQCASVGVHVNFAPVVDVNCNPDNPIINVRSFGATPDVVIRAAVPVMRGMQDVGIITCAKHFPGHGDTTVDSHEQLPVIMHDRQRLDAIELAPFKAIIDAGVDMVMVGHLLVPTLDAQWPASLSHAIITELLRKQLGFDGIVCTDGLKMKAVRDQYSSAQLARMTFTAGNDILLQLPDPVEGIHALTHAFEAHEIDESELDACVSKLLRLKERVGLHS